MQRQERRTRETAAVIRVLITETRNETLNKQKYCKLLKHQELY